MNFLSKRSTFHTATTVLMLLSFAYIMYGSPLMSVGIFGLIATWCVLVSVDKQDPKPKRKRKGTPSLSRKEWEL